MRLTEFRERVYENFGTYRGDAVVIDHIFPQFGFRNASDAIDAGFDPKDVWHALCVEFDVPRQQW